MNVDSLGAGLCKLLRKIRSVTIGTRSKAEGFDPQSHQPGAVGHVIILPTAVGEHPIASGKIEVLRSHHATNGTTVGLFGLIH